MSTVREFLEMNYSSIGTSGGEWDSCEALNQLNLARSAIYGLDNFAGLIEHVCVSSCKITRIPWFAESIKAAYTCIENKTIQDGEYWVGASKSCCGRGMNFTDNATYSPVPITNKLDTRLAVRCSDFNDVGKKVTISYYSFSGSLITEELRIGEKDSVTEVAVRSIASIRKDSTAGVVSFFSVDENGCAMKRLFYAHPMETSLRYREYCFSDPCCDGCSQIVLAVKKKFFPFTKDHYNLQIEFPEHALSLAMEAIEAKAKRTLEGFTLYSQLLRSSLNYLQKNTAKEHQTDTDMGATNDYPSVV